MAFCTNCGAPLKEGQKFCTGCGAPAAAHAEQNQAAAAAVQAEPLPAEVPAEPAAAQGEYVSQAEYAPQAPAAPTLDEKLGQLNNTPDTTADFSGEDIARNKGMAVLAYIGILVLIPLFAAKESPYARYHANQGLVLLVCGFAFWILGKILGFLGTLGGILCFILAIIGIVNAVQGKAKELPVIGKVRLLK